MVFNGHFVTVVEEIRRDKMESDDAYGNEEIDKTWSDRLGPLEQRRDCMERLRSDVLTFTFTSDPTQGLSTLIECWIYQGQTC